MASATLPVGSPMTTLRSDQVNTSDPNRPAVYTEDAAAKLVYDNYQRAKNYVENNAWLLEWQETDILYQSPIPNRLNRVEQGRPARVPRFLVAKFSRVLSRSVKRALFAEQVPFMLRPQGRATQAVADAWTAIITLLLKRMKFRYHAGLQINCQTLQGTGLGKYGWNEKKRVKRTRKRKHPAPTVPLPTGDKQIPTELSDAFEDHEETVVESWPFYEYRRLGTTLFDPKWCTPDEPGESAGYCVDVDYVNFFDLQKMRQLSCYDIPSDETLKAYFFAKQEGSAPTGSQIEDSMTAQGSAVTHAEGRNRQTDASPLEMPLLLLEQWDEETVKTVLCFDGHYLTIRNEEHKQDSMSHTSATWWPIDNSGYGMGIGRINGGDQRINQGVLNECLKLIAYPFNAPILTRRGENAPTQNVINRMGGFWALDAAPGEDVRKAACFMEMPPVPADAWRMLELSQTGGEQVSGADAQMQQGSPSSKQGATRSATGAARVASLSDQNVADPVDSFADGVIVPVVEFLIHMVKTKMPLKEIRQILSEKHAAIIENEIKLEQFLESQFEVSVLAGAKLLAKQGIQQLIPFFLQIVQQPQLLEFLHQKGDTVDFEVIMDLMLQVSELQGQPDIFRKLTPDEQKMVQMMNPALQKIKGDAAKENLKGDNKVKEIHAKGEVDMGNTAAKAAFEKIADGVPLARAFALEERANDKSTLENGPADFTQ